MTEFEKMIFAVVYSEAFLKLRALEITAEGGSGFSLPLALAKVLGGPSATALAMAADAVKALRDCKFPEVKSEHPGIAAILDAVKADVAQV